MGVKRGMVSYKKNYITIKLPHKVHFTLEKGSFRMVDSHILIESGWVNRLMKLCA